MLCMKREGIVAKPASQSQNFSEKVQRISTMHAILLHFLVWSAIARCASCSIAQRKRHITCIKNNLHNSRRIHDIQPSPFLMMMGKGDNKIHIRRKSNNSPTSSKRIRKSGNNVTISKPKLNDNAARHDAHIMKQRMKEAKLVEKLLVDAVDKMTRSRSSDIAIPPSKLFPSVRQCNSGRFTCFYDHMCLCAYHMYLCKHILTLVYHHFLFH